MKILSDRNQAFAGALAVLTWVLLALAPAQADEPSQPGDSDGGRASRAEVIAPLLEQYCFDCHSGDAPEAGIALDSLDLSIATASDRQTLQRVLTVVRDHRMPPDGAEAVGAEQRQRLTSWLQRRLAQIAEKERRSGNWTRNRRLTVQEYNFTMQRLFAVDATFGDNLPPDPISRDGYRNNSQLLGLSPLQMECYLDSAHEAVDRYVQFGPVTEQPVRYHIELEDLYYSTADRYGTRERAPEPVDLETFQDRRSASRSSPPQYVGPLSPIPPGRFPTVEELRPAIPKLHQQYVGLPKYTSSGEMIVRIRAAATPDRDGRFPRMRVESGITLGDGCSMDTRVLGEIDVTAPRDAPQVYEFRIRTEDLPTKGPLDEQDNVDRLSVFDMFQVFISNVTRDERAIYDIGRGGYHSEDTEKVKVPLEKMAEAGTNFLYLDCIEIEMLPGRTADGPYRWSVDMARAGRGDQEQSRLASEFLSSFMQRAYRRPVSQTDVAKRMELYHSLRTSGYGFKEALRESLCAVLVSPSFLFLEPTARVAESQQPDEASSYALASRLSYLLWQASPDEKLMRLAEDGALRQKEVLVGEARRMLSDARSRRFLDDFCRQWLRLDKHRNIAVDSEHHPEYDDDLADTTIQETLDYFADVFTSGASALELIDSDYAVLNDRLADHYGLDRIAKGGLQKVQLPKESVRGGILTQASLLTMNSDGRDSHPIRRGVWVLDRLLNTPPPPPPPNVPDLNPEDPDFRGLSLKEQIELHRKPGACQSCHRKIDPWGLALENFDATGRWREEIRADGHSTPVDAAVELPGGEEIGGIRELKNHLYQDCREQFAKAMVHHMLTYTLGRSLDYADQQQVDVIHQRFAAAQYRLKELVLAIVDNEVFRQ